MTIIKTAFQFIRYDRNKSIGVVIGIIISTFLIAQQWGIFTFLTGLMTILVDKADAQIWVVDAKTKDVISLGQIDTRYLNDVRSIDGVGQAFPVLLAPANATFAEGNSSNVILVGSNAPYFCIGPNAKHIIQGKLENLLTDGAVSIEYFDRKQLGGDRPIHSQFEINGKRAHISILTKGLRFFGGALVFTTLERAHYYSNIPNQKINAVLANVTSGADPEQVVMRINRNLTGVHAWLANDFSASTRRSILSSSGIAASTGTLIIFAVISGILIIGLTMYSSALDRIKDYGTLKAIGASDRYLARLIITQALIFAFSGFTVAWILIEVFRYFTAQTGLIIQYRWYELIAFLLITLFISMGGAVFAIRRIKGIEPASVFRD